MNVLVAPCSFKGSLSGREAARAILAGFKAGHPRACLRALSLADGGEGTLDALLEEGGERVAVEVSDPLGRQVRAEVGILPDGTAAIESAQAAGLLLLRPEERDPLCATSRGVGELLVAALARRPKRILVGLGGSATVDGGAGMLEALGARFLGAGGAPVAGAAKALASLERIDLGPASARLAGVEVMALCDVQSPLLGPRGARMYMRQKGASEEACAALEAGLRRFAEVASRAAGVEVADLPGGGAAGGMGAALALLGARLVSGSEHLLEHRHARAHVAASDLVLGGEGRVDEQTLAGKAMLAMAELARSEGKPFIVFAGSYLPSEALFASGVTALFSIIPGPMSEAQAMAGASEHLRRAAEQVGRLVAASGERG
jgi:glycerate kinase